MSRSKKITIPALRRRLQSSFDYQKRQAEKYWKGFNRLVNGLFRQPESDVFHTRDDKRRMPAKVNYVNPIFWLIQSALLVARYVQSRQYSNVFRSMPAILGFVFPVVLSLWIAPDFDQELDTARSQMSRAEAANELDLAEFYARKVCAMLPDESGAWMRLAVIRDRQGRSADAENIAIEKGVSRGYIPAAEWLANRRFSAVVGNPEPDPALEKELVDGLKWIITRREDDVRANFMLGTYLLYRGESLEARAVLRRVTMLPKGNFPEAWYSLAVVEGQLGDAKQSQEAASLAADGFLDRDSVEDFKVESFMQLVRSLLLAQREQEAIQLIQQKNADFTQYASEFRQLTGEVFAAWSQRLRKASTRSPEDVQQALKLISQAINAAPAAPIVVNELVALAGCSEIPDTTLDQHLDEALAAGVSPGVIHFIKGARCISKNPPDIENGLQHLQLAEEHNPGMPGLLNNIADAIVESKTPDLDQALRLVNQALALMPDEPHVHDTRGKIYLRMGEPMKAIADFEKALKSDDLRPIAHARLAEAWRAIGNSQRSAFHEAMVESHRKVIEKRNTRTP
jgi:tetratricopeptide (TPR) repeat protein